MISTRFDTQTFNCLKFDVVRMILIAKRYISNPFRGRRLTPVLSIWYSIIEFMRNFRIFKQVHRKRNYRDRSHRIYLDTIEYFEPNHITIHRTTTGVFSSQICIDLMAMAMKFIIR